MKYHEKTEIEKAYYKPFEACKILGVKYHRLWILTREIAPNRVRWAKIRYSVKDIEKLRAKINI